MTVRRLLSGKKSPPANFFITRKVPFRIAGYKTPARPEEGVEDEPNNNHVIRTLRISGDVGGGHSEHG